MKNINQSIVRKFKTLSMIFLALLLAVTGFFAFYLLFSDGEESDAAYADDSPTEKQLSAIGYSFDSGYTITALNGYGDLKIKLNNSTGITTIGENTTSSSFKILAHTKTENGETVTYHVFFELALGIEKPNYVKPGETLYNNRPYRGTWINLTFATPQSKDDLKIDSQGRIYFPITKYDGSQVTYYLGADGLTSSSSEAEATPVTVVGDASLYSSITYTYDGTKKSHPIAQYSVSEGTGQFVTGGTVSATNAGTYTFSAAPNDYTLWYDKTSEYKTVTWSINKASITNNATVTLPKDSYDYTGSEIKPDVTVTFNGTKLTNGTDYTVSYSNNTSSGKATVTVTGTGNYTGTATATFTIAAPLTSDMVTLSQTSYDYDGTAKTPTPTVTFNGTKLTNGKDYTVSYSNNINAGTATVTVTGTGNYTGTVEKTFTINKATLSQVTVSAGGGTDLDVFGGAVTLSTTASGSTSSLSGVTYSSSDTAVATISGDTVTAATSGTTGHRSAVIGTTVTVMANVAASDNYNSATGTVTLTTAVTNGFTVTVDNVTTAYENLQDAVKTTDATVTVVGNPVVTETVTIPTNANITIVGYSGATLTCANGVTNMFSVPSGASLTVKDLTVDGSNASDSLFKVAGELTLDTGAVVQNGSATNGGAVCLVKDAEATSGGSLTVASGATVQNNTATNGGAIYVSDGCSAEIEGTLYNNSASSDGGAVYLADGATLEVKGGTITNNTADSGCGGAIYMGGSGTQVSVTGGTIANNRAATGNGVYVGGTDNTGLTVAGNAISSLADGAYIEDAGSHITIKGEIEGSSKLTVEFSDAAISAATGVNATAKDNAFVISSTTDEKADNSNSDLKNVLRVANAGYTFYESAKDSEDAEIAGLTLIASTDYVAYVYETYEIKDEQGNVTTTTGYHGYTDIQSAIDAAANSTTDEGKIVYLGQYVNTSNPSLNQSVIELTSTLTIPDGANITFDTLYKVSTPKDGESGTTTSETNYYTLSEYEEVYKNATENATEEEKNKWLPVAETTVKRGENLTAEMICVKENATLTLTNVTLDGGAVWGESGTVQISDDGEGGAGSVETNNTGVTAHAPVIVNQGTLNITDNATIQNNDNNYAAPGEGFGSQNYGGGVRNEGSGTLTMTGGTIQDCYSREGGAIMNVNKPVKYDEYTANTSGVYYVYDEKGELTELTSDLLAKCTDGEVKDDNGYAYVTWNGTDADGKATEYTSYLYAGTGCSVTISGGDISGNVSQQKGAAIQTIYGDAETIITTGTKTVTTTDEQGNESTTEVTTTPTITGNWSLNDLGVLSVEEGGSLTVEGGTVSVVKESDNVANGLVRYDEYEANKDDENVKYYVYGTDGKLTELTSGSEVKEDADGYAYVTLSGTDEAGNATEYTSYLYYMVDNQNAIYLFNQYSAEDYADYATTPFIEGVSVGELAISGSPAITGDVHLDDGCYVVDPDSYDEETKTYQSSDTYYDTFINLDDYVGTTSGEGEGGTTADDKINVTVSDDYNGSVAVATDEDTIKKVNVTIIKDETQTGDETQTDDETPDLAGQIIYVKTETVTGEDGTTTVTTVSLNTGVYELTFDQTDPGMLAIGGTVDPAMQSIIITIGEKTYTLSAEESGSDENTIYGAIDANGNLTDKAVIDLSDLTVTSGEEGNTSTSPATQITIGVTFGYGDGVDNINYVDAGNSGLSEEFSLVQFDSETGVITVPESSTTGGTTTGENTYYKTTDDEYKTLESGLLPNDMYIDDDGNATIIIGGTLDSETGTVTGGDERTINVGVRADAPDSSAANDTLYDVTDNSITIKADENLEYAIAIVTTDEGNVSYEIVSEWKTDAGDGNKDGYIEFDGLSAETKYAVVVRTPSGTDFIPSVYIGSDSEYQLLDSTTEQSKSSFEDEYGKLNDTSDRSAIKEVLKQYDALDSTTQAIPSVEEKYEDLLAQYADAIKALIEAELEKEDYADNVSALQGLADSYKNEVSNAKTYGEMDDLLLKAKAALGLADYYDELIHSESYIFEDSQGVTDISDVTAIYTDALEEIKTATAGSGEENALDSVLTSIVTKAEADLSLAAAKSAAERDYLDSYYAINGVDADLTDETVQAVMDKIEAATGVTDTQNGEETVQGINGILKDAVEELVNGLLNYDGDELKDSATTKALIDGVISSLEEAVTTANESGNVADLSALVQDVADKVESQRAAEKQAAQDAIDDNETINGCLSELVNDESKTLAQEQIDAAKEEIASADTDYTDYDDITLRLEKELELIAYYDQLLSDNSSSANGKDELGTAIESCIADLQKAYEDYTSGTTGDYESLEEALSAAVNDAKTKLDDAVVAALAEDFKAANSVLTKDFADIDADDESALSEALTAFGGLSEEVQDYLDAEAQKDGYTSFEKQIEDKINKSQFEAEKDEIIVKTNGLLKDHDGEIVKDAINAQIEKIEEVVYEAHTNDTDRGDYADQKSDELNAAYEAAEKEFEHARDQEETVNAALAELEDKLNSNKYGDAQKEVLQDIYDELYNSVSGVTSDGDADAGKTAQELLDELLAEAESAMNDVKVNAVITGDIVISDNGSLTTKDETGDYGTGGSTTVWGIVTNDSSMDSDILLKIEETKGDAMKTINDAADSGKLVAAEENTELDDSALADLVSNREIKATLDIYLLKENARYEEFSGIYVVKVLMAEKWRSYNDLQVVYVRDDGTVEVYQTTIEDGKYIVFSTTHFSEFYILGEKEINLTWLIVLLSVVLFAELVAIAVIIFRRKNDEPDESAAAFLPLGSILTVYAPNGAVAASIALGVCVAVAAVAIVVVALFYKRKGDSAQTVAVAADVAEATVASPVVYAAVTTEAEEEVTPDGLRIIYNKSFTARIIQSDDQTKEWYSAIKNELLSYSKVRARTSWRRESFNYGRNCLARLAVRGKTLCLYLDLDAGDYEDSKYKVEEIPNPEQKATCMYRIKNPRRAKYAKDLIAAVMAKYSVERVERENEDYLPPYESTPVLIEKGLIKRSVKGEAQAPAASASVVSGEVSVGEESGDGGDSE